MTGKILTAVPITIAATGRVDRLFAPASSLPKIPPTNTIKTLSDINSAKHIANIQTFLGRFSIIFMFFVPRKLFFSLPVRDCFLLFPA